MTVVATGRPAKPRDGWKVWTGLGAAVAITVLAGVIIDFTFDPSIRNTAFWLNQIKAFITPNWTYIPRMIGPMWTSLAISFVASAIVAALVIVLSMFASRVTMRVNWVYRLVKWCLAVWRSLPDVVWAMLFVAVVGSGGFAGMLAMVAFGFGIAIKLTAETIDGIDTGPLDAIDASGGTAFQRARVAVVPQILPNYTSYALYNFESSLRSSVVLGYVGAGGIGQALSTQSKQGNYGNVAMIVLATLVLVIIIDSSSAVLRRRLSR
ncbi:MAG: phosphonate ABC transporter, permease protein PhnE [Microbacterium sp.]